MTSTWGVSKGRSPYLDKKGQLHVGIIGAYGFATLPRIVLEYNPRRIRSGPHIETAERRAKRLVDCLNRYRAYVENFERNPS